MPGRARLLTPLGWALLTGVAVVAAVGAEVVAGRGMPDAAGDVLAGVALLVGGAVAWGRRPGSRSGPLSVLAGVAWFAGDLTDVLVFAHRGPLVHLLLSYPSGRVDSRAVAVVIGAAYVDRRAFYRRRRYKGAEAGRASFVCRSATFAEMLDPV